MASNFDFLREDFPPLYEDIRQAESYTFSAPGYAAILCRRTLEAALFWLYEHDDTLYIPVEKSINSLLHTETFKELIGLSKWRELDAIRRLGNQAAHKSGGRRIVIRDVDALMVIKYSFRFLSWLSNYYGRTALHARYFDESLIPKGFATTESESFKEKIEQERLQNAQLFAEHQEVLQQNKSLKTENEQLRQEITAHKALRQKELLHIPSAPPPVSEAETRRFLIDLYLREAGWDSLVKGRDTEYLLHHMPTSTNASGKGYADYVLWGDDGLPLAVIEAKQTSYAAAKGQHQAFLYANALEKETGQRPVIFFTNGYDIYIWDDTFCPPRHIYGFYTKEELQTMIRRRTLRQDIRQYQVNKEIAGRPYQLEAIARVANHIAGNDTNGRLTGRHRKALLVMATGSGKTRTAAAIVDMLTKNNWAKRVLFLADRNALVTQAQNAFKEYLPQLSSVDLTREKEVAVMRLVFSTYPTMMNMIDQQDTDGRPVFSVGHFDIIFIDEAHRSIYKKYQAIFDYFDSILIGLTATPKKDIDRNTYNFFELEDDIPTFSYELTTAVTEGYLVPPKSISVPVKFVREGIKYKDLSPEDRQELEEKLGLNDEPEEALEKFEIRSSEVNSFLFNEDTVEKVLDYLMQNGQKVAGGDRLGKTIIFAKNHAHAVFIQKIFDKNYPEYGGHFAQVIDNQTEKAADLLQTFCVSKEELLPQIAISVDMMDTGVDAPRVLNLVFFKPVKSYAKFWQMIGRGTRLCPDIFGPGLDKEYFTVFDICQNFEYFGEHPDGITPVPTRSLSQLVFMEQLYVAHHIQSLQEASVEDQELARQYLDTLHTQIVQLDEKRFEVRKHLKAVHQFRERSAWDHLTKSDLLTIEQELSSLPPAAAQPEELAKNFDLKMYRLQNAIISQTKLKDKIIEETIRISGALLKKKNIQLIAQKENTLQNINSGHIWQDISLRKIEQIRSELRELIQLLGNSDTRNAVYTNLQDELDLSKVEEKFPLDYMRAAQSYKDRVTAFIRKNRTHIVISKLFHNQPITPAEMKSLEKYLLDEALVDKETFQKEFGEQPLGKFIRSIIGLDQKDVQQHFAAFIQQGHLSPNQMRFMDFVIKYFSQNGYLEPPLLFSEPFTQLSDNGLSGIFDDAQAAQIVQLVKGLNDNARAAG